MSKPHLPVDAGRVAPGEDDEFEQTPDHDSLASPTDYSAVGGPDSEPSYGRTRSIAGDYPFNEYGGPYDRDEPSHVERGGIQSRHRVERRT